MTISGGPGAPPVAPLAANDMITCHPAALVALLSPGFRRLSVVGRAAKETGRNTLARFASVSTCPSLQLVPQSEGGSLRTIVCSATDSTSEAVKGEGSTTAMAAPNGSRTIQRTLGNEQIGVITDTTPSAKPRQNFIQHKNHESDHTRSNTHAKKQQHHNHQQQQQQQQQQGLHQYQKQHTQLTGIGNCKPQTMRLAELHSSPCKRFSGEIVVVDYINHYHPECNTVKRDVMTRSLSDSTLVSDNNIGIMDNVSRLYSYSSSSLDSEDDCNGNLSLTSLPLEQFHYNYRDVIWTSSNSLELRLSPVGIRSQDTFSDHSSCDYV